MARVWSYQFNMDTFNFVYASLDTDQERAEFLTGLYRGGNGVSLKEGHTGPMATGHAFGIEMREKAESYLVQATINGAKRWKGRDTQDTPSTVSRGPLQGVSMDGGGCLEGSSLRIKDQGLPVQEGTLSIEGTSTPPLEPAKKKPRSEKKPTPKLEAILGPKGSPDEAAYWKLVGIFGGNKNPAPTQTAQAFVEAICKHDAHTILAKAQNLRDAQSDPQYMPQLLKWLDGQGYLNPDIPARGGLDKPLGEVTDAWTEEYQSGRSHAS